MIVELERIGMQWIGGSICLTKGNGDLGDTYALRQQQLQAKLSVPQFVLVDLSYSGAATARCLEAPSRYDKHLLNLVVVIPASMYRTRYRRRNGGLRLARLYRQPRCSVVTPQLRVQQYPVQ